jgi:lipid-A-disaccharide synthase
VVRALRERFPDAEIEAFGGAEMAAAGARVVWPMERYTVMGFAEVIAKIPAHARLLRELSRRFRARRYDLVILIDYPGFHLRVAESARAAGLKVLHYIAPQFWAWRPERAKRFRRAVDRFAVIFPFEAPFFQSLGLPAEYVGHPLLDRPPAPDRVAARAALGIPATARVLGLFPGSRNQELARHWVAFRNAGLEVLRRGAAEVAVVATIPGGDYPNPADLMLARSDPATVLAATDAVLAKSGTTTLEAALADRPMVAAYRVHPLTGWMARRLIRVPWISLPNLIANAPVVTELVQGEVRADRLAEAIEPLLDPDHASTVAQRAGLAKVRDAVGGPGAARRVATIAADLLK